MSALQDRWICCQLGAREHYAVPRALHYEGHLAGLITDAWVVPPSPLRWLPTRWGGRLLERFHPDLVSARVAACTSSLLFFELRHRRCMQGWDLVMARNRWFQRQAVGALINLASRATLQPTPVLFCYSYAALEPLRWARARGWRTILCQIDPGPRAIEIVAEEHRRHPELAGRWQAPPPQYWEDWRAECEVADVIIANSNWSRDGLLAKGVPAQKVHVVPLIYQPPGFDRVAPKSYPDRFSAQRPLRVLFLGHVNLHKGIARLLDAARLLRTEPVEFWLVGPLDLEHPDEDRVAANLRWIGPVRRGEVSRYYGQADVFLFPTLSDGFGLTQLEAQAHRLPVIASRNCGAVVCDGENGFLLQEASPQAIAEVLLECVRNPGRLAAMSSRSQVAGEFSPACVAAHLLKLVERARVEPSSTSVRKGPSAGEKKAESG